ncbi:GDSL-type esterase/lipase family protein [Ruminococcaceae bacterium OttesenSCG-928-A11]|nr:GDSL-type esterase/lipase family protein [Ruminococcaceae bacterium OttesenSCG-928-A11]
MKTILCFGDSNTHGFRPGIGGRFDRTQRWPGALAHLLGDGFHVVEEGLSGRTTAFEDPVTEGLCGLALITPLMASHAPVDTLVVMLGTNDTKARFGAEPTIIARGMQRLLEKALYTGAWAGKPDILLVSPAPIDPGFDALDDGDFGPGAIEKSMALAKAYAALAQTLGIRFFDAGTVVKASPVDGVHLSADSHRALAVALAELLR